MVVAAAAVAAEAVVTSAPGAAVLAEPVQAVVQGQGDVSRCVDGGGQLGGLIPPGYP